MLVRSSFRIIPLLAAIVVAPLLSPTTAMGASTHISAPAVSVGSVAVSAIPQHPATTPLSKRGAVTGISAAASTRMHVVFADDFGSGTLTRMMEYGNYGERVIVGDWNGDGRDGIAIRRGNKYYFRNTLTSGPAVKVLALGRATDQALVGDWNGDGKDTIGIRRGTSFVFRNALSGDSSRDIKFSWGRSSDAVLVGDWNGDGRDTLAVHRGDRIMYRNSLSGGPSQRTMYWGRPTDRAYAGDWDGNRSDSIALRRGTTLYFRNLNRTGAATMTRIWGTSSDRLLMGDWNGDRTDTVGAARTYNERYRVWELVNAERSRAGRASVTYSETCLRTKYAQSWANHLAATGKFEHQRLGRGLCAPDAMAENIAAGYSTASSVMKGWMNSAGHRANILSSARKSVTVGIAASSDAYGTYWVQNFT